MNKEVKQCEYCFELIDISMRFCNLECEAAYKKHLDKVKNKAKKFAAFITDVAEAMKKHKVEDMLCVFGLNGEIRNTYIPLSEKGEMELYCKLSDGIHEFLQLVGHKKSGNPKFTGTLKMKD